MKRVERDIVSRTRTFYLWIVSIRRRIWPIGLDKRDLDLSTCITLEHDRHTSNPTMTMWPVQTLTLLLCLTDEEQLFAQSLPALQESVRVEQIAAPANKTLEEEQAMAFPVA